MFKQSYKNTTITIVDAEKGKYLVFKDAPEELNLGRPTKIIFDNSAEIPELEEKEV